MTVSQTAEVGTGRGICCQVITTNSAFENAKAQEGYSKTASTWPNVHSGANRHGFRPQTGCMCEGDWGSTIPRRGKVTFVMNVTYIEVVDQWTLCSGPRRTHIIPRNGKIILHTSWYGLGWLVNDYSDCISWMVQLISALFWACRKTDLCRNWKTLVNTKAYASFQQDGALAHYSLL